MVQPLNRIRQCAPHRFLTVRMIAIKKLVKRYHSIQALRGIDLEIGPGILFAYLGPNGSGKTTTIRILTGLTHATEGGAWLNGFHVEREPQQAKHQLGLVTQTVNLDQELSVRENLEIHGRLFGMNRTERRRRCRELLDYIDLADRADDIVRTLSGGMKRRIMVARALMHSPRILFLDEPTVGLDPVIRRRLWSLIKKIQADGTTVFLTTHYIEEAEFLAERVAFLDRGTIIADDTPENLMNKVGQWAIDTLKGGELSSSYFTSKEDARRYITQINDPYTLRRVSLEDAFVTATGKTITTNGSSPIEDGGHDSSVNGVPS